MDQAQSGCSSAGFCEVLLSPIRERSDADFTDAMLNHPALSIFDPPEEYEENGAHLVGEESLHGNEQGLSSDPTTSMQASQHLNVEPEGRLTRSKSKRVSLAPEEGNGSKILPKKKGTKKSTKKVSKETQVMPRMLPPVKKRASKKNAPANQEMKENVPPELSNDQQEIPVRKRAAKTKASADPENHPMLIHVSPNAPKKQQRSREIHNSSGMARQLLTFPPLNTSADVDNIVSAASIHESSVQLSSSEYHGDEHSSMYGIPSFTEDDDSRGEIDRRDRDFKSLAEAKENSSTPLSGLTIKIPDSNPNKQPMALLLHPEMFKGGNTVGITVSQGEVIVSSKHDHEENPKKNGLPTKIENPSIHPSKKNGSKKRNSGRKSRGSARSRKDSWTSSEDSSDSSCSCSSCDSYCSSCDGSTSSSSSSDCHHRCNHRHC